MKKSVLYITVFSAIVISISSCIKNVVDPKASNYTCNCTYVANSIGPSAGQPNKTESTTVSATSRDDADFDCNKLNTKYNGQYYSGTCLIQ
jgi:hypothetical protein